MRFAQDKVLVREGLQMGSLLILEEGGKITHKRKMVGADKGHSRQNKASPRHRG